MVELSTESISNLERGIHKPSFETIKKISDKLEVPLGNFVEYDPGSKIKSSCKNLLAELNAIAHNLSDKDLKVAVSQMSAFKQTKN